VAKIEPIEWDQGSAVEFERLTNAMKEAIMVGVGVPGWLMGQPTIQDAFMADIVANPEDDTPRLIYADWLEDHGRPSAAELIRHADPIPVVLDDWRFIRTPGTLPSRLRLAATEVVRNLPLLMRVQRVIIRRGFISEVHAPLAVLQEHLPRLARGHPIERVRATDKEPEDRMSRENVAVWWGIEHGHFDASDFVPYDVWELMLGEPNGEFPHAKDYHTVEAAHEALSRALLAMARQ
jgi:uncharacterized protein (TIGR02996 family)